MVGAQGARDANECSSFIMAMFPRTISFVMVTTINRAFKTMASENVIPLPPCQCSNRDRPHEDNALGEHVYALFLELVKILQDFEQAVS